jgi:O-antigen ligase
MQVILDNPNGIGPFEFGRRYGEDPHNAYLHTFIAYGWLGGFSYLALVATTFWLSWRIVFVRSPYQPFVIPVVATFTGTTIMGVIIHSDHWRHWYLMVGLIWALSAATEAWKAARREARPFTA